MAKYLFIVVIVLLSSVVGYLAWDRQDKISTQEQTKQFEAKYFK